jgi:hypothetical protein
LPCYARQINAEFASVRRSRTERSRRLDAWADHLVRVTGTAGVQTRGVARALLEGYLPATKKPDAAKLADCRSRHPGPSGAERASGPER